MFRFITMTSCYQLIVRLPSFFVFKIVDFLIGNFEGDVYIQGLADCSEYLETSEIEIKLWRFYAEYAVVEGDPKITISLPRKYDHCAPF